MTILRALLIVASLFMGGGANAQEENAFVVHKLRENVFVLTRMWQPGQGNNMGVVVGDEGLLLVNSMMSSDSEALDATLKTISDKPVKYVINSNWDPYNILGNAYFAEKGAVIVAQQDVQYAPRNANYEPVFHQVLFEDTVTINLGNERVHAYRSGGHSMPHANIRLEKANVVFMADSFRPDWFGVLGPTGLKGYLAGLKRAVTEGDDDTVFISGTYAGSAVNTRADLLHEMDIREAFVSRIGVLYKAGKTVEEMRQDDVLNAIVAENFPVAMKLFGGLQAYDILPTLSTDFIPEYAMTLEEKRAYTGTYAAENGISFDVLLDGETLFAQSYGRFKVMLKPVSETEFLFMNQQEGEKIVFERDANGTVVAVHAELGESFLTRRIPAGRMLKQE